MARARAKRYAAHTRHVPVLWHNHARIPSAARLSVRLPVRPPARPPSVHLPARPSSRPTVRQPARSRVCSCACPSVRSPARASVRPSARPRRPSVRPSAQPAANPPVCSPACPPARSPDCPPARPPAMPAGRRPSWMMLGPLETARMRNAVQHRTANRVSPVSTRHLFAAIDEPHRRTPIRLSTQRRPSALHRLFAPIRSQQPHSSVYRWIDSRLETITPSFVHLFAHNLSNKFTA